MSGVIGVELSPTRLRAVMLARWGTRVTRTADVAWEPSRAREGVRALRDALGDTSEGDTIALAIGVSLLHVARAALPPVSDAAREQMIALEPSRYFPTHDAIETTIARGTDVAFGVEAASVERWCDAFAEWGTIARSEPSPIAVARALGASVSGRFELPTDTDTERATLEVMGGKVTAVRRMPSPNDEALASALPTAGGVAAPFLAAYGVALGADDANQGVLANAGRRRAFNARRRRQLMWAALAAFGGVAFATLTFDRWRERTLIALEVEAARLAERARPALDAQDRLSSLSRERAILNEVSARRVDPSAALAAIGQALPRDVVVLSARATGEEWRLDGTAANAAALVPALDKAGGFENVRSLSASSRFQDGSRMRETFSIAFRVRAKP